MSRHHWLDGLAPGGFARRGPGGRFPEHFRRGLSDLPPLGAALADTSGFYWGAGASGAGNPPPTGGVEDTLGQGPF